MNSMRVLIDAQHPRGHVLHWNNGALEAIEPATTDQQPLYHIIPKAWDVHVHGGGGFDAMQGQEAVLGMCNFHAAHGTGAIMPTTVTAPQDHLEWALEQISLAIPEASLPVLGVHLEGPFISPHMLGAQPNHTLKPSIELLKCWLKLAPIRYVTMAPELEGALECIHYLSQRGVWVSLGHSQADYATCQKAFAAGAKGFSHFGNAMSALHHRAPNMVGYGLMHQSPKELIADGQHLHPDWCKWLLSQQGYVITDAVAATGMPAGVYQLGEHQVHYDGRTVVLADGCTLAGSALTMQQAVTNMLYWGMAASDIAAATSGRVAGWLGYPLEGVAVGTLTNSWLYLLEGRCYTAQELSI